ncbi:translation initiation factor Sui1 [Desulfuromonas acetoxidans]|uniref:Translation initiation factor SUI1 n=1 Tax=Desulfuromonas acetoxidans (strain DSM 684 / 11070) TaxID=281689 RepID=Q1K2H3_DESA6|nr:translation initiation factor Sui1 [Desulfuromonas acetoxidans]EAT16908.1 translation initiation factor SUI1 [Desulfuromonas acetoxidans DSM 684]MBF0645539.1 translation initiation factor Sui1 [Desulfuromonas acetoxidans]NVD23855.1 translation initiation factor Sui1 [Desulfuromonas acetoxidans]NVE15748.1 translation initiation factor Sui1 [Desulfuromonas acetoxidans]
MIGFHDDDCRPVYSSEKGRLCPQCGEAIKQCRCQAAPVAPGDGIVRISFETKGRKGKGVTVIRGIPLAGADLKGFVKTLKKQCGSGGAVKQESVEIQGDHRSKLLPYLQKQGWKVKLSGG